MNIFPRTRANLTAVLNSPGATKAACLFMTVPEAVAEAENSSLPVMSVPPVLSSLTLIPPETVS